MTKAELIDALHEYPDDALVTLDVRGVIVTDDTYDFFVQSLPFSNEVHLTTINHNAESGYAFAHRYSTTSGA
jgi:hypothetical protein